MSRQGVVLVGLFLTAVAASGCLGGPLSQEEAEARAESAVAAFASSLGGGEGKIKSMVGQMTVDMSEEEGGLSFGSSMSFDLAMHWGQDDVVRVTMTMKSGGMSFEVAAYCSPRGVVIVYGEDSYESRAVADAADADESLCNTEEAESMGDPSELFSQEEFAALEQTSVEPQGDGTVKATYTDPEDGTVFTFIIDKKGRLVHMEISGDEGEGSFDMTYGPRERIEVPAAESRLPADAYFATVFESGTLTATIDESPEAPLLSEIQVRVTDYDWETEERTVHVSFEADQASSSMSGWTFGYNDADADGRLSVNDTFTLSHPDWEYEWDHDVELYDEWAAAYVNESFTPGPALFAVLVALAGLAAVLRRRG